MSVAAITSRILLRLLTAVAAADGFYICSYFIYRTHFLTQAEVCITREDNKLTKVRRTEFGE